MQRFAPTAEKATELKAALTSLGCKARVARQAYAFRVVAADEANLSLAQQACAMIGLGGPTGGTPARSAMSLFAYDVRA